MGCEDSNAPMGRGGRMWTSEIAMWAAAMLRALGFNGDALDD